MGLVSVVGLQWGDEGKGKITDLLAQNADIVVRYQGGNNAGHSINFDGKKYSLRLLPSGAFNPNCTVVIAGGVVVNPKILLEEIEMVEKNGFIIKNLKISDRSNIILPYHEEMDVLIEDSKEFDKVGTTKKGIGPAYSDKMTREGIRFCEFCDSEIFKQKLEHNIKNKNLIFKAHGFKEFKVEDIYEEYKKYAEKLKKYMTDTSLYLDNALKENKIILCEGAQGVMLDIEHGTYPYVTSSSPSSSSIPVYVGLNPKYVNNNLGIVKAYTSRVGEGPFPTKIKGDIEDYLVEKGHEYGTVTKRRRNVGWLDLVQLKYSIRVSGVTKIALMLLDVLEELKTIKVCIGYELNNKSLDTIPALEKDYANVKPIYKELEGWNTPISDCKNYDDLPNEAKEYIKFIENYLEVNISIISVGADRTQTLILEDM